VKPQQEQVAEHAPFPEPNQALFYSGYENGYSLNFLITKVLYDDHNILA
jgi:hypothetical protein